MIHGADIDNAGSLPPPETVGVQRIHAQRPVIHLTKDLALRINRNYCLVMDERMVMYHLLRNRNAPVFRDLRPDLLISARTREPDNLCSQNKLIPRLLLVHRNKLFGTHSSSSN